MLDNLPDEIIIDILCRKDRLSMINCMYTSKRYNSLTKESFHYNCLPFRMTIIDSLFEIYLYTLKPQIDIIVIHEKDIDLFLNYYYFKMIVCIECDIRLCNLENIRENSDCILF